jgi:hypothetical protein
MNLPILFFKNPNHERDKQKILDLIEREPSSPIKCCDEENCDCNNNISNSDWREPDVGERKYWNEFYSGIKDDLHEVYTKTLLYEQYQIDNYWFQQYNKKDTHDWHWHERCFYANVYFVELPEDAPPTELQIPITGEIIRPNVKEGDILIFPSILRHRSAPNESDKRKTVIAFNVY